MTGSLSLNDFPVETDAVGDVSRVAAFKFHLTSKGYRTSVTQRKAGFMSPWVEVTRTTEELTR